MRALKLALPTAIFAAILFTGGTENSHWAKAQASTPITDSIPARDAATSREDISLTNSCIEDGKEKLYCLCVTKIFKHEMTLRQYRGAAMIYKKDDAKGKLSAQGYTPDEVSLIQAMQYDLTSENMFRTRCDKAETYFSAALQD